ncbi:hypothetical protein C0J50_12346 [Silurus asotus]|uniref:Uncharacterized protein n=1 Tax=Silurus asotus TaxID=30991 RepID=A0AAD5FA21_SILAS|nr:hypothetical protein C0J50_12346 [Silurus asotus]
MTTPNYPGVSYPERFGLCGGGNQPVEHDEDEDEDKTLM